MKVKLYAEHDLPVKPQKNKILFKRSFVKKNEDKNTYYPACKGAKENSILNQ